MSRFGAASPSHAVVPMLLALALCDWRSPKELSLSLSGGLHARIVQGKPTFLVEHALFGLLPDWCFKCSGLVRNLGLVSSSLLCHINRVQPDMKLNILLMVTMLMQMKLPTILSNVVEHYDADAGALDRRR